MTADDDSDLRITSYDGSFEELSAFVTGVWRRDYEGRMAFPLWSAEYLRWHFTEPGSEQSQLLACYDGDRLVATLLGLGLPLAVGQKTYNGLLSSWLSIEPDYRGQAVVKRLKEEQQRRHHEAGGDVVLSYRYVGTKDSKAVGPTEEQRRDPQWSFRRVGFWARSLNAVKLAEWSLDPIDRVLAHAGRFTLPRPNARRAADRLKAYQSEHLPDCLRLANSPFKRSVVSIEWTPERLEHHLNGSPVARTFVFIRDNDVRGLISYHTLPFLGRTEQRVAVVDLICVEELSFSEQTAFLNGTLSRMRDDGAILALKLRTADVPASAMLATGFFPRPTDSFLMAHWLTTPHDEAFQGPQRFLWR